MLWRHTYVYTCIRAHVTPCQPVSLYVYVCVCVCVCACVCTHASHTHTRTHRLTVSPRVCVCTHAPHTHTHTPVDSVAESVCVYARTTHTHTSVDSVAERVCVYARTTYTHTRACESESRRGGAALPAAIGCREGKSEWEHVRMLQAHGGAWARWRGKAKAAAAAGRETRSLKQSEHRPRRPSFPAWAGAPAPKPYKAIGWPTGFPVLSTLVY